MNLWKLLFPVTVAFYSDDMRLTERQLAYWTEEYSKIEQMLLGKSFLIHAQVKKVIEIKTHETDDTNQEPVVKQWNSKRNDRYSIPYDISFSNAKHIAAVKSALRLIEDETCLNFRTRKKSDFDYIHFTDLGGCWSYVGRNGGKQPGQGTYFIVWFYTRISGKLVQSEAKIANFCRDFPEKSPLFWPLTVVYSSQKFN